MPRSARGTSQYLPDGKVPLYPPVLSDGAASLLPDGERPAIVFTVRLGPNGEPGSTGPTAHPQPRQTRL